MNKVFITLLVLAIFGAVLSQISEVDIIMESMKGKPTKEIFKVYHYVYKRSYKLDSNEGIKRYKIFKANLKWVEQKNAELGKQVYGVTQFMDLTDAEFRKYHLMDPVAMEHSMKNLRDIKSEKPKAQKKFSFEDLEDEEKVSQSQTNQVDWRTVLNPPKDQGDCGSCWAFAAMGSVEGNYKLHFKQDVNFSEQYLVNCDSEDSGCDGGWPTSTFEWLKGNGVVNQSDFPYTAKASLCKSSQYASMRQNVVKDFSSCETCARDKWIELLSKGPLVVAMDASDEGFSKYKPKNGEPWIPATCGKLNHAVVAVGFVTENGKDYLIVRNSWGTTWGWNGYFKVPADKHCGIMENAWLPEVQTHKPFPEPICNTFYSECKFEGKVENVCNGEKDFNAVIGKSVSSLKLNPGSQTKYYNFFQQPNCKGEATWNYEGFECDKDHWDYAEKKIVSAATNSLSAPWGCIIHFDQSCYTGASTLICNSIPDVAATKFTFTPGSIFIYNYTVKAVVFFEDVKFRGKGYGVENKEIFNTDEIAGLNEAMQKAKSVLIVRREPSEPSDN